MGFYGMLMGLTLLFAAALMSNISQRASMQADFSNGFVSYCNIQKTEAFKNMVESTRVQRNSTLYGSWLNSIYVSAKMNGVNVSVSNSTMLITTKSKQAVYAILQNS